MTHKYAAPGLLERFIKSKALTQAEAARQIGVVPAALHGYLKNTQRPRHEIRERIARWSGGVVPIDAWLTADERRAIKGQHAAFIPDDTEPDSKKLGKVLGVGR